MQHPPEGSASNFHVLLISPPQARIRFNLSGVFPMQPLGIASLAAYLRERGVSASLLDAVALGYGEAETIDAVCRAKPDLAAFSTTIFNIGGMHRIAEKLKRRVPGLPIVLGGHGMVFSAETLAEKIPWADFFVKGEGEEALYRLVLALENHLGLNGVPGLVYREGGKARENPKGEPLVLDSLPLPALDMLPQARYSMHPPFNRKPPLCLVETARGCGFSCNFCSLGRSMRVKNVNRVISEIRWAKKIFAAREIHFIDPTFTANRSRALEICRAVGDQFPGLAWTCKTRVDCLDPELARAMAKSGCYLVSMGVESGSQRMLDAMNKGVQAEQNFKAAESLRAAGIGMLFYIMFGAPGENESTISATMRMLSEIKPDYALFAGLMPDPLSALVNREKTSRPFTGDDVFRLYFTGERCGTFFENSSFTGIDQEILDRWVRKAFFRFYANPAYIARRFFSARSPVELKNLAAGALLLAKDAFWPGRLFI